MPSGLDERSVAWHAGRRRNSSCLSSDYLFFPRTDGGPVRSQKPANKIDRKPPPDGRFQPSSFPHKRESILMFHRFAGRLFLFNRAVSLPRGERVTFLASPRKVTKRRRPGGDGSFGASLRCSQPRAGPETRSLRSLKHQGRTSPEVAALLGVTYGVVSQKQNQTMACDVLAFDLGPLRRRRGAQAKRGTSGAYV